MERGSFRENHYTNRIFVSTDSANIDISWTVTSSCIAALGIVIVSDNATCEVCYCMAVTLMINLRSILCKVNAYSNKF